MDGNLLKAALKRTARPLAASTPGEWVTSAADYETV